MRKEKNIGPRIIRNYPFLKALSATTSDKRRRLLIKNAEPDELLAITEVCHNIIKSYFPITENQKHKMLRYREAIRKIGRLRSADSARRVLQRGKGVSGMLISAVLVPVISEVVQYFLSRNRK